MSAARVLDAARSVNIGAGVPAKPPLQRLTITEFFADPAFPLTVYHDFRNVGMALHTHEFGELVYVRQGRGVHRTEDGAYPIEGCDLFYIPQGMPHGYDDPHDLELFNILFLPERLPLDHRTLDRLPGYRLLFKLEPQFRRKHSFKSHLRLQSHDADAVLPIIRRLADETSRRRGGYETMATGLFLELIATLTRAYERRPNGASVHLMAIDRAMQFVTSHYSSDVGIADLADISRMSLRTFQRAFRETTGKSPKQYLLEVRLNHAKDEMLRPGARITQVAYQNGFHDGNYFSRIFREHVGQTPRQWIGTMRNRLAVGTGARR